MKLSGADVSRAGRTARGWNHETDDVELEADENGLSFRFSLSSKGGGITDVRLMIDSDDFAVLASSMIIADRTRAMREMAACISREIAKQADHDKLMIRKGRESVLNAANQAYSIAPEGRDHAERLTRDMVKQFVEELNKKP